MGGVAGCGDGEGEAEGQDGWSHWVRRWRRGDGIDRKGGRQTRADDGWRWSEWIRLVLPRTGPRSLRRTKRVNQEHNRHL
jgi:hypothetical protein